MFGKIGRCVGPAMPGGAKSTRRDGWLAQKDKPSDPGKRDRYAHSRNGN